MNQSHLAFLHLLVCIYEDPSLAGSTEILKLKDVQKAMDVQQDIDAKLQEQYQACIRLVARGVYLVVSGLHPLKLMDEVRSVVQHNATILAVRVPQDVCYNMPTGRERLCEDLDTFLRLMYRIPMH